jgi:hypothetical protein
MSSLNGHNGNGQGGNGHGGRGFAGRAVMSLLRWPSVALMRRYADWVEHSSDVTVSGEGASYAGGAVYVCRALDVPLVFLHRAHYDDRTLITPRASLDGLAMFATAAGLVVTRAADVPPEIERTVRAGNAVIFAVAADDEGREDAARAVALAKKTSAPLIVLRADGDRTVRLPIGGRTLAWPGPRGAIRIDYGALQRIEGEVDAAAAALLEAVER